MQHDFILARIRLTRTAAERGPVLSGACGQVNGSQTVDARVLRGRGAAELTFPRAFVLAGIRLTRTAAERGPVLFGACGQVTMFSRTWNSRRWVAAVN